LALLEILFYSLPFGTALSIVILSIFIFNKHLSRGNNTINYFIVVDD
jgi:hypothetical protein